MKLLTEIKPRQNKTMKEEQKIFTQLMDTVLDPAQEKEMRNEIQQLIFPLLDRISRHSLGREISFTQKIESLQDLWLYRVTLEYLREKNFDSFRAFVPKTPGHDIYGHFFFH